MKPVWIKLAVIYCLFGFSNAVLKLLATSRVDESLASWFSIYFASVMIVAAGFIFLKRRQVYILLMKNKPLFLFLAYMAVSCLWALDPSLSFMSVIRYIVSALFGLFLLACFSEKDLLGIFAVTLGAIAISSLLIGLFLPAYGLINDKGPNHGSWQGAFTSRNGFAIFMNIAFFIFMSASMRFSNWQKPFLTLAALAVLLIILSGSGTGLIMLVLISTLPFALKMLRFRTTLIISILLAAISMGAFLFAAFDVKPDSSQIFGVLGKSPTLTGRTDTWQGIWYSARKTDAERLLFGYGAQDLNFTTGGLLILESDARLTKASPGPEMDDRAAKPIDNAYVGILLKFGIIGAAILLVSFLKALLIALHEAKTSTTPLANFYFIIMLVLLINGITESVERQTLIWIFFTLILARPYIKKGENG